MSHSLLPHARTLSIVVLLASVALLASVSTLGQNTAQDPPLYRTDTASTIGNERPITMLTNAGKAYVRGDAPVSMTINYKCTKTTGNPGTLDSGILPNQRCSLGSGAAGSDRVASVFYDLTGANPSTNGPTFPLEASGSTLAEPWDLTFSGERDFSQDNVTEGQTMRFFIRVLADTSDTNPGTCSGGQSDAAWRCFDPKDTTGQERYTVRFDTSEPQFTVNEVANANAFRLDRNAWFLYSNANLSSKLPTLIVTVLDNDTGSPIDPAATAIYRGAADNDTTALWDSVVIGDGHAIAYTYDYSDEGGESFEDGTNTTINLQFADEVGHAVDTRGDRSVGLTVVMDVSGPTLDHESSWIDEHGIDSEQRQDPTQQDDLVALGGKVAVRINATDMGGSMVTPPEFLDVQVRLKTGTLASPPQTIPWNATINSFYSENVTVPNTWASGVTRANVTVTDPVGLAITRTINGSISVDVDRPVVTPVAPLNNTQAEGFESVATITFRVRAEDPGDTDDWDGANTEDSDNLGIDTVRVHYKVGRDGPVNTVRLSPIAAANTWSGARTFNPEDEVFYYMSSTDLAGNEATYPAASDPHLLITNETANDGRFLRLQIDQLGPVIQEARDLAYVGGGPHEFLFEISDGGSGLDKTSPRFHWRLAGGGTFREVALTEQTLPIENATGVIHDTRVFRATIPTQEDGSTVQWHVTARDKLENTGALGSSSSPESSRIDVVAPTITVSAPDTSSTSRFNITWEGTDAGSGVKDYTLQFRVGTNWFTVPTRERTTATSYEVCAATETTYQFRVSARDNAGNERGFPEQADASTQVDAPTSCAEAPEVTISQPADGATLTGATPVRYLAASTSFPDSLRIRLEAGPTAGAMQAIARDLDNTGEATWNTAAPNQDDLCLPDGTYTLRVVATDANGLVGDATAESLTLNNGITNCSDRDNDGLLDEWEFQHFGDLSANPGDDADGDGFSNLEEMQAGTAPTNPTSRPSDGGGAGGGDGEGWNNLYLLVILGFVGVLGTFVVGMARRW